MKQIYQHCSPPQVIFNPAAACQAPRSGASLKDEADQGGAGSHDLTFRTSICWYQKEEAVLTASSKQSRLSCHHVFSCSTVPQMGGGGGGAFVCVCVCIRIIGKWWGDRAFAWDAFSTDNEKDHQMESSKHRNLSTRGSMKWSVPLGMADTASQQAEGSGEPFSCAAPEKHDFYGTRTVDAGRENFTGDFIRNDYLTWYWSDVCLLREDELKATLPSNTFGLVPLRPVPWCTLTLDLCCFSTADTLDC